MRTTSSLRFDYRNCDPPPEPRTVTCLKCNRDYITRGISHGWCFVCYVEYGTLRSRMQTHLDAAPRIHRWLEESTIEDRQLIPWDLV